jgi:hypothetical protein
MHTKFWLGNLKGRVNSEGLGVDEDNIRMHLRETRWEVVKWIHVAQDRDQWRALASTVMNLRVP